MNQLQTVLDALILLGRAANLSHDASSVEAEAIAIVKQMMQAEPVAEVVLTARNVGSEIKSKWVSVLVSELPPVGTKLYAAATAVPAWLPIESVPLDGAEVLLGHPDGSIVVGCWSKRQEKFISNEDDVSWALYWMPLPAAPKGAA